MMPEHHELMGGKVHLYRRENSPHWQCSTYLADKNWRVSTKEESLGRAKDFAEDWYLELKFKKRLGELKGGKTFQQAAEKFLLEYEVITLGERSPKYVEGVGIRLKVHLLPFFGDKTLAEITPGLVQDYRIHRLTSRTDEETSEPIRPARSTLLQEIVVLRQVLKTANRHGWLAYLPNIATPYKTSGKITHRAWFSPKEYKQLYEATRERAKHPKNPRWKTACENMHDYVLFMANTGLRPDEAARLEFRDVAIVTDEATGERILEIEVRGKRGVGYCKSTEGAVLPFERLRKRKKPRPSDLIFGKTQRDLFNIILEELNLKFDRDGHRRTSYSLRHTYICLRLMEGADIYQIAKNCRTSVEMIEKYYASHIKNTLDAAAINVRKPKPEKPKKEKSKKRIKPRT
jgi:integrase